MKMTAKDYAALTALLDGVCSEVGEERLAIHRRAVESEAKDADKRFRWDLFWAIPQNPRFELMDRLYEYLNDTHIDAALRKYVGQRHVSVT